MSTRSFQLNFKSPAVLAGPDTSVLDYEYLIGGVFVSSGSTSRFLDYPMVMTDPKNSSHFKMRQMSDWFQMGFDLYVEPDDYPENILSVNVRTTPMFASVFRFFPDGTQVGDSLRGRSRPFSAA